MKIQWKIPCYVEGDSIDSPYKWLTRSGCNSLLVEIPQHILLGDRLFKLEGTNGFFIYKEIPYHDMTTNYFFELEKNDL